MIGRLPHPLARASLRGMAPFGDSMGRAPRPPVVLSDNENPYGGRYARYPERDLAELQARYAAWLAVPGVHGESVLFTHGSEEAIALLLRAFVEPGRETVAVTPPVFPLYAFQARVHGAAVESHALSGDTYTVLDEAGLARSWAKILFLCNPNNPVGAAIDPKAIAAVAGNFPGLVVVDEAYAEFAAGISAASLVASHENVVVLRTFSKAWGMAGLRLGAVVARPAVLRALRIVQAVFSVTSPAIAALGRALERPERVAGWVDRLRVDRGALAESLAASPLVDWVFPSEANFVCAVFADADRALLRLAARGIAVRDCRGLIPGALRLTVGTPEENAALVAALEDETAEAAEAVAPIDGVTSACPTTATSRR